MGVHARHTLDFSSPPKAHEENAYAESFIGKFRTECLKAHWFLTLDFARRNARLETKTTLVRVAQSATKR